LIVDTDVLIWFLRGNQAATDFILEAMPFSVSIVTYMELVQGMRDKRELAKMKKAFAEMKVKILPLTEDISLRASDYVESYALSHSMEMADALIAGTCMEENDTLVTANDKHYRVVEGLRMMVFRVQ
jgi:predicted nucleic acid-binding protein